MRNRLMLLGFALMVSGTFGLPTLQSQSTASGGKSPSNDATKKSLGTQQVAGGQSGDRLRLHSRLVTLTVTVTDVNGRVVTSLLKDNFEVYDDGVKQEIAQFSNEDSPISIGFIYDVSGSMEDLTPRSFIQLRKFFEASHQDDEYFIIAFNEKPYLLQDFTASTTAITTPVMFAKAKGSTALIDAVYLGVEKARQGRHPRKALLIISDGQENHSRYSRRELRTLLEESGVPVYTVTISQPHLFGLGTLIDLSQWSGGLTFAPVNDGETRDMFTQIALTLRSQYAIGFYPIDASERKPWHKVKVNLVNIPKGLGRPGVFCRSRYPGFDN